MQKLKTPRHGEQPQTTEQCVEMRCQSHARHPHYNLAGQSRRRPDARHHPDEEQQRAGKRQLFTKWIFIHTIGGSDKQKEVMGDR